MSLQVEMDGDVRLLGLRVSASQNPAGGFEGRSLRHPAAPASGLVLSQRGMI